MNVGENGQINSSVGSTIRKFYRLSYIEWHLEWSCYDCIVFHFCCMYDDNSLHRKMTYKQYPTDKEQNKTHLKLDPRLVKSFLER